MRPLPASLALAALLALSAFAHRPPPVAFATSPLDRPADPIVLTGADVPTLTGIAPSELVAFRYDSGWHQIPVQVDERAMKDLGSIYNSSPNGIVILTYTDAGTFTGPDPDPTLDSDDEIVFMAKDAGAAPPSFSEPAGVIANTGVEVEITDPLNGPQTGYVYLFRQDGTLSPSAGQQYVSYTFNLLSGPYLTTYDTQDGPNPENSVVTTPDYSHHFSDRWISDEIRITMGAATGVDILDRHKALFAPGNCVRSENTFSDGEGAFIVNKSGLVRAIRSYVGANSGPLTQREHFFYERRQDIRTSLRVHAIPGIMDFFDYSPAATGMTYYDDLNTSGVTVDGNPDSVALGAIQWEMVSGAQGSLLMTSLLSTNIAGLTYTSYYLDDSTPDVTQCTGDAFAYGSSGVRVNQTIACTDPALDCTNYLHGTRIMYYEAPGLTVAGAQALSDQANTPLTYTSRLWRSDIDGDGIPDSVDNCPSVFNPGQENTDAAIDNGPGISGDDKTIPNAVADNVGDACQTDPDIDHDGLPNSEDMNPLGATGICARFAGADDGHPNPAGGDVTNDDDHDGNPAPPMGTDTADNGPSWDTDNDGVLDGVECALGHNPRDAGDRPSEAECGGAGDTDGDGLLDAWETCKWGTNPNIVDSDGDTLGDCTEAVDTNGNGIILGDFSADALNSARATLLPAGVGPGRFGKTMDFDLNGNGIVAGDFGVDTLETDRFTLGILPCQ
jgi:hypothetical protein